MSPDGEILATVAAGQPAVRGVLDRREWCPGPPTRDRRLLGDPAGWPEGVEVRSLAGSGTRILLDRPTVRETLTEYEQRGGYADRGREVDLVDAVERSGLLGRGGAAFPTGQKLRAVAGRAGPRYLVANGEEGEPLSVKDRWLLRVRPHLVLDGLFLAAEAIGAARAFVYLSDEPAAASVAEALDELEEIPLPVELVRVARTYVGGEETSVVRAINGGPALPTDKPPRPFEAGVEGHPTLVANVETLANLPSIATSGPERFLGSSLDRSSPGTFLLTLSGAGRSPGLYEVPLGLPLGEVIAAAGGLLAEPSGVLMGGFFGGILGPRCTDLPLSYPALRAEGSGLGCGAIWVLGPEDCPVQVTAEVMAFFAANNARQCGPCIRGTSAMSGVLDRLTTATVGPEELGRLEGWSQSLRHRGACAHLDGAAHAAETLLLEFPAEVKEHATSPCSRCARWRERPSSRLEVRLPSG